MPTYENSLASRRDILRTVVNIDKFAKEYPKFYKKYGFNPSKIGLHSHMKLSFYCKYCNAIHYKSVAERIAQVYGCSQYNAIYQTSIPETILWLAVMDVLPDAEHKRQISIYGTDKRSRYELDIFSPSVNFAIEYDGGWHNNEKSKIRDENKTKYCIDYNIYLLRIRQEGMFQLKDCGFPVIYFNESKNYDYIEEIIFQVYEILKDRYKVGIPDKSKMGFQKLVDRAKKAMTQLRRKNSFANVYPGILQLLSEKEKKRAFSLRPKSWKGDTLKCQCIDPDCKNEFERTPKNLVSTKGKCPKCRMYIKNICDKNSSIVLWHRKVKYNRSLAYKAPQIAIYYSQRNSLSADEIGAGSSTYDMLFNCPYPDCQSEYTARVKTQVKNGCRCKVCKREAVKYQVNTPENESKSSAERTLA